jgi:hypothetical protein
MPESPRCREIRELLPEVAMGVASGDVRAKALAHLAGCADCRRELEEIAATVDELLLLAPEHEPPTGFDVRVLDALDDGTPSRHRLRTSFLLAAAFVLVAAMAAGFAWSRGEDDRTVAAHYRDTLAVANGSYLSAAHVTVDGTTYGNAFAYQGDPSWLFVTVEAAGGSGSYPVRLVTTDGRSLDVGTCSLRNGSGSWGSTVDVPIRSIDRIELLRNGLPAMVADLN